MVFPCLLARISEELRTMGRNIFYFIFFVKRVFTLPLPIFIKSCLLVMKKSSNMKKLN